MLGTSLLCMPAAILHAGLFLGNSCLVPVMDPAHIPVQCALCTVQRVEEGCTLY